METITDYTWMKHLYSGEILEKFDYGIFQAVALKIPSTRDHHLNQYHYRILFFPKDSNKPVLAVNLESSIIGSYCLTEQIGKQHLNFGPVSDSTTYKSFKLKALRQAEKELSAF